MLRDYNEDNPATYEVDFDDDKIEFKILPLGFRDEYIGDLGKDGSYTQLTERVGKIVQSINGETVESKMKRLTHLSDINGFIAFIIRNSFLPEDVAKNSQPSPESSEQEKDEGATNLAETEDDCVSTTQQV